MDQVQVGCRICGSSRLQPVLSLGSTPLANALLTEEQLSETEARYPLDLVLCEECTLLQITETVPPEELFSEYLYFSSFSDTMLNHSEALVGEVVAERKLGPESLAAEVASNDGYLLQFYKRAGVEVLGIEPASNIAEVARERGIPTVGEFFGAEVARKLAGEGRAADVIHAHNVLAHVADLNGVAEGFRHLLKPQGAAVIEVPYVREMLDGVEFDTIYHEHLCYFSLTALDRLFETNGLKVLRVKRVPIHGGSLRLFVGRADSPERPDASVAELMAEEASWGVGRVESYRGFREQVERLKEELGALLKSAKSEGKRIAAYGASAKGSTLLNYFGIGRETLDFVADRSSVKQGRYTPGTHLPILPPEALVERMPEYTLLLTWNFAAEILKQQSDYRDRGGKFIIPIPRLQVV